MIDDLEEDVRKICGVHGVVLAVGGSLRTTDKKRRSMLMLKCRHGVKNRQASWQALQYDGETQTLLEDLLRRAGSGAMVVGSFWRHKTYAHRIMDAVLN